MENLFEVISLRNNIHSPTVSQDAICDYRRYNRPIHHVWRMKHDHTPKDNGLYTRESGCTRCQNLRQKWTYRTEQRKRSKCLNIVAVVDDDDDDGNSPTIVLKHCIIHLDTSIALFDCFRRMTHNLYI
jgi:hypothetical protein